MFFALLKSLSDTCPSGIPPPNHQSMHDKREVPKGTQWTYVLYCLCLRQPMNGY